MKLGYQARIVCLSVDIELVLKVSVVVLIENFVKTIWNGCE